MKGEDGEGENGADEWRKGGRDGGGRKEKG